MIPTQASTSTPQPIGGSTSIDLWKFFEERGGKLKESMFSVVSWIIGFAAIVLGFAVKEGVTKEFLGVNHPALVISLCVVGILVLALAVLVIRDYGKHINRTFARADAARDGESSPQRIWNAGQKGNDQSLPPVCLHLLGIVGLFATGFALLVFLALFARAW